MLGKENRWNTIFSFRFARFFSHFLPPSSFRSLYLSLSFLLHFLFPLCICIPFYSLHLFFFFNENLEQPMTKQKSQKASGYLKKKSVFSESLMLVTKDFHCVVTRVLYITIKINVMFTGKNSHLLCNTNYTRFILSKIRS